MNKNATGRERMERIRKCVLDTAQKLFMEQGYGKTTIRQIVQESGISSGSIYHLFPGKEAVFQGLVDGLMDRCAELIERAVEEPGLERYASLWAVELHVIEAYPVLREIYYHAYTSATMFEKLVRRNLLLQRRFQVPVVPGSKAYARTLLIKGAMRGYIASFYFGCPINRSACRDQLLGMMLHAFGVGKKQGNEILKKLAARQQDWQNIAATVLNKGGTIR